MKTCPKCGMNIPPGRPCPACATQRLPRLPATPKLGYFMALCPGCEKPMSLWCHECKQCGRPNLRSAGLVIGVILLGTTVVTFTFWLAWKILTWMDR